MLTHPNILCFICSQGHKATTLTAETGREGQLKRHTQTHSLSHINTGAGGERTGGCDHWVSDILKQWERCMAPDGPFADMFEMRCYRWAAPCLACKHPHVSIYPTKRVNTARQHFLLTQATHTHTGLNKWTEQKPAGTHDHINEECFWGAICRRCYLFHKSFKTSTLIKWRVTVQRADSAQIAIWSLWSVFGIFRNSSRRAADWRKRSHEEQTFMQLILILENRFFRFRTQTSQWDNEQIRTFE